MCVFIHRGISFISLVALALLFSSVRDPTKREAAELCVSFPSQAQPPDPELAATSPPSTALSWGPLENLTEHIVDFFDKL